MILADVKANKNNKKQRIWQLYLTNFYKKYDIFKFSYVKRACTFHLISACILSILILTVKNRGWVFLLNRQNLLSMTEVICRQSLDIIQSVFYFFKFYQLFQIGLIWSLCCFCVLNKKLLEPFKTYLLCSQRYSYLYCHPL